MKLFEQAKQLSDTHGIGNAYKMLTSFLNPDRAYAQAGEQLQNYFGQAQQQLQPYIDQGQAAHAPLAQTMQSLLNPQALHNEWLQGYETSPHAQHLQEQAMQQGLEAASSMGLMGSSPVLQALQAGSSRIVAQDRDNYLNNLLQKYLSGAQMAQGLYGTGAQMGGLLGQLTTQHGQGMAEMTYGQQAAPGMLGGQLLGTFMGMK